MCNKQIVEQSDNRERSGMSFAGMYSCLDTSPNRKYVITDSKSDLQILEKGGYSYGRIN